MLYVAIIVPVVGSKEQQNKQKHCYYEAFRNYLLIYLLMTIY